MKKYYFFRDLDNNSNLDGITSFHAAGIAILNTEIDEPTPSGKDIVVKFFEPFNARVETCWRAFNEVELLEVIEEEHKRLSSELLSIENFIEDKKFIIHYGNNEYAEMDNKNLEDCINYLKYKDRFSNYGNNGASILEAGRIIYSIDSEGKEKYC